MNEKLLESIRQWHLDDRQANLKRTFSLGELIIKAVIHTGMTEYQIIKHIMDDLGELAFGMTTYNRAARMYRVFTDNQKKVLIESAVSLDRCEILAGRHYDGKRRIKTISDIKHGKIKSPWREIIGIKETVRKSGRRHADTCVKEGENNPDYVSGFMLYKHGEIQIDALECHFMNLFSRLEQEVLNKVIRMAEKVTNKKVA